MNKRYDLVLRWFSLLMLVLVCSCEGEPALLVHIEEWPEHAESVQVLQWLDGVASKGFTLRKGSKGFLVYLPEGRQGQIRLLIWGEDRNGCRVSEQELREDLGPALRVTKEQTVRMVEMERKTCLRPAMLELPVGIFQMGSASGDPDASPSEKPKHEVHIKTRFAMAVTEVTQRQYQQVTGMNPSDYKGNLERPVEHVSWFEAVSYCNKLSALDGLPPCYQVAGHRVSWPEGPNCLGYRLPTEAEWEYAARAGVQTVYSGSDNADEVAWSNTNSVGTTQAVGTKLANRWGLHDLSGNVCEWVWDEYEGYGATSPADPTGPLLDGSLRLIRGGSLRFPVQWVRVAIRGAINPDSVDGDRGFRIVRSLP